MERKEWLKTFIDLADRNAKALEYRKALRIKAQLLPVHVRNLEAYRRELSDLEKVERRNKVAMSSKTKEKKVDDGRTNTGSYTRNPKETMGSRKDNSEDR